MTPRLTDNEIEVIKMVAVGCPNKEIAYRLDKSIGTIRTQIQRAMEKLNARSRIHAVITCLACGIISLEDIKKEGLCLQK